MNVAHDFRAELHSLYNEQSVLGGILLLPSAYDAVADIISENDFFIHSHRVIWRTMVGMFSSGEYVDIVTVDEKLKATGNGDIGIAYLGEIASSTPTAANVVGYARIVVEKRIMRELNEAAAEIMDITREHGNQSIDERIDRAQALIMGVGEKITTSKEPVAIGSILYDVVHAIEERSNSGGKISGLSTGFADFDRLTNGLQKGDLIIVAGRPAMGKTSFSMNIAEHVAFNDNKVALVFSMEMSAMQLTEKAIANAGRVDLNAIRSGRLSEEQYDRLALGMGKIQDKNLIVDDACNLSVAQMRSKARKIKRNHGSLDLILIDYLQLMNGSGKSRNEDLGEITRGIKLMARELECPVILLSQLSRKCEERTDKRPMMSDLRDSGAIEQDADLVVMMYRHQYYYPDMASANGIAEAIIRKQRMGELGTTYLAFRGEYSQFNDLDQFEANAYRNALDAKSEAKTTRGFM